MAQLTKGLLVQWSADGLSSWTNIPDITSIPTLIGSPSNHDVTTIYSTQKEYIEGLPDNGGTLEFGALFTPELFESVTAIQAAQKSNNVHFRVALPAPLSKAYKWKGTLAIPSNDEWQPDNPILGKLVITPSTAVDFGEYSPE